MADVGQLRLVRRHNLQGKAAKQLKDVYEEAFPPEERSSYTALKDSVRSGTRWLFIAETAEDLLGFAMTQVLSKDTHYLEYLAVAAEHRTRGIGGQLLEFVVSSIGISTEASALIFEVDSKVEDSVEVNALNARRLEFYRRHGATLIECAPNYRAPDLTGGSALQMRLMWLPLHGELAPPSGPKLRACIRALYRASYSLGAGDSLLESVLNGLIC